MNKIICSTLILLSLCYCSITKNHPELNHSSPRVDKRKAILKRTPTGIILGVASGYLLNLILFTGPNCHSSNFNAIDPENPTPGEIKSCQELSVLVPLVVALADTAAFAVFDLQDINAALTKEEIQALEAKKAAEVYAESQKEQDSAQNDPGDGNDSTKNFNKCYKRCIGASAGFGIIVGAATGGNGNGALAGLKLAEKCTQECSDTYKPTAGHSAASAAPIETQNQQQDFFACQVCASRKFNDNMSTSDTYKAAADLCQCYLSAGTCGQPASFLTSCIYENTKAYNELKSDSISIEPNSTKSNKCTSYEGYGHSCDTNSGKCCLTGFKCDSSICVNN